MTPEVIWKTADGLTCVAPMHSFDGDWPLYVKRWVKIYPTPTLRAQSEGPCESIRSRTYTLESLPRKGELAIYVEVIE